MATQPKRTLMEQWEANKQTTIEHIHEIIGSTTKYVEFRANYKEGDIKKVIVSICENLRKGKIPENWSIDTINQASAITRFFADIIKSQKEKTSILNKGKNNNDKINQVKNPIVDTGKDKQVDSNENNINNNLPNNDNHNLAIASLGDKTNEQAGEIGKKRKTTVDEVNDIITIDESRLNEIVDADNVNPTKRQRVISKNYIRDEDELQPGWHKINNIETRPVVIAKPDGIKYKDSAALKNDISNTLEQENNDYGEIEQVTKSQKVVVIHFDDISNRDKFMKYVKTTHTHWNCEIPTLKNPCIRINGVNIRRENDSTIDWEKWLERIHIKNKWIPRTQDSVFKINFKIERNNKWNIVFEVSPNIRQAIVQRKGRIFAGLQKYEVYDTFNIHTCYNCSSYGHTTNQCGQQPVCRYCAKQHYTKCGVKNKSNYKCHACRNTGHAFNDPECPQFLWRLKHELQFINTNYELIMMPPNH